jgi:hypothetical protein
VIESAAPVIYVSNAVRRLSRTWLRVIERQAGRLPSTDPATHGERPIAEHHFLVVTGRYALEVSEKRPHCEKVRRARAA